MSRPASPESPTSPMNRSFDLSSSTIDELTSVLSDLNRVPSPASNTHGPTCCCCREDCENTLAWLDVKAKLESRLILSAEVGQALLQKHEAYVRQVEKGRHRRGSLKQANLAFGKDDDNVEELSSEERLSREYDILAREKAEIEKKLNHALVNNEVTEVSNKTLMQELQEARETISRLTAHHARSMGWDARLTAALKDRDDMQQERDGESLRARLAESRFAALKDKTTKLQAEVRRLQEALEEKRQHRLESTDSILQEAKNRLEAVRSSVGLAAKAEQDELAQVVESLMSDNEVLKRDNSELQRLLAESREDVHTLQEELEEHRVNAFPPPRSGPSTPLSRHFYTGSVSSLALSNAGPSRRPEASPREPLTPDSSRRPLSPVDSLAPPDKWNAFSYPRPQHISNSSHLSYEVEDDAANEQEIPEVEKPRGHRPLLLLTRSRGVQTEPWAGIASPSPRPSHLSASTPPDPRSESSSISESISSRTSSLFDRATALLSKMSQADALTLTTRLKRQNLKGADLSHLSRTTVSNIIAEAIELRSQFRSLLEDDKTIVTCTRKDLRVLFKFLKDAFMEMGQMRVTLNDVIFDPSCAARVSELSLNPSKAAAERERQSTDLASRLQLAGSWIAPISRLFAGNPRRDETPVVSRTASGQGAPIGHRFAPKLGPALAASTTTVNVEFSGAGVGRATTTLAAPEMITVTPVTDVRLGSAATLHSSGVNVMNIFAGAPKPAELDPWVVLPRTTPRKVQSTYFRVPDSGTTTIGRSTMRRPNRLSRNVDAVIDSQQHPAALVQIGSEHEEEGPIEDEVPALPELRQSLRRRGLSDSSIRSTFTSHAKDNDISESSSPPLSPRGQVSQTGIYSSIPWRDGTSVFQALSKTVHNLRMSATESIAAISVPSPSLGGSKPLVTATDSSIASPAIPNSARVPKASSSTATSDTVGTTFASPDISDVSPSPSLPPENAGAKTEAQAIDLTCAPSLTSGSSTSVSSPFSQPRSQLPLTPETPGLGYKSQQEASTQVTASSQPSESATSSPAGLGLGFLPGLNIPNIRLASWAAANTVDTDPVSPSEPRIGTSGSMREDSPLKAYTPKRTTSRGPGHTRGRASRDFL